MLMRFILTGLLLISSMACTTQHCYEMTQDYHCDEYRKHEDPHYTNECPRKGYDEYKQQREVALEKDNS